MTDGDLRDALGRHARLVEEDAAEVVAVGEDLGLQRQERAARVDEVDAGQAVLQRDLLRAQVLLHRHREVGAALHRGVVGDDHHFASRHAADAGHDARGGARRRRTCRRRRAARARETASRDRAAGRCARAPAACPARGAAPRISRRRPRARAPFAQLGDELLHAIAVGLEDRVGRVDVRVEDYHPQQSVLKPQAGQRQTACMRTSRRRSARRAFWFRRRAAC